MKQKKYRRIFIVLTVLLILSFGIWIATLVNGNKPGLMFFSMVPMIAVAIALRVVKERYDSCGFFTNRQAAAFYKQCVSAGISEIGAENRDDWCKVYTQSVGAFPEGNDRDRMRQAKIVFNKGKEYIKKRG